MSIRTLIALMLAGVAMALLIGFRANLMPPAQAADEGVVVEEGRVVHSTGRLSDLDFSACVGCR
jgi:hypothetical protein